MAIYWMAQRPQPVDPMIGAVQSIHDAGSQFLIAIHEAESAARLRALKHWIGGLAVELLAIEDVAGERLNKLGEQT